MSETSYDNNEKNTNKRTQKNKIGDNKQLTKHQDIKRANHTMACNL